MNITDNSKFEQMIKNRPSSSLLPAVNKRLVSQYLARSTFAGGCFLVLTGVFVYKFALNANSGPFLKSRRSFSFESDPYSGKVRCDHKEVPNTQHGF